MPTTLEMTPERALSWRSFHQIDEREALNDEAMEIKNKHETAEQNVMAIKAELITVTETINANIEAALDCKVQLEWNKTRIFHTE